MIVLCALLVFFPIVVTTTLGLRLLDHEVLDAARVDGASGWKLLRAIELPLSEVVHPLPLVSNGLGVLQSVLEKRPEDIRAVIAATLRGFQYVSTHPGQAVEISKQYIPGLGDPHKAAAALAILKATIALWQDGKNRQGYLDPATWQAMARFLLAYHILSRPADPATAYSNNYLPT